MAHCSRLMGGWGRGASWATPCPPAISLEPCVGKHQQFTIFLLINYLTGSLINDATKALHGPQLLGTCARQLELYSWSPKSAAKAKTKETRGPRAYANGWLFVCCGNDIEARTKKYTSHGGNILKKSTVESKKENCNQRCIFMISMSVKV